MTATASIGQIFKAYDIRATYPDKINEAAAWKVGYGTGQYLMDSGGQARGGEVVVSRDMRPHSQALCAALCEGLRAAGVNVIDLGMCDTSFIYFAVNHLDALGGIQTTASHNPIQYNGFKISGRQARPVGADSGLKDIQRIVESLSDDVREHTEMVGGYRELDLWKEYRAHVLGFLTPLKRKITVAIDTANGMGGKLVSGVFCGVENLEVIPINFEITGSFAHDPNPLVAENMVPTQRMVRERGADLGVSFDGDADRCILTDDQGRLIGCDHLTALMVGYFVRGDEDTPTVVYDLRSSKVVEQTIRAHGARPHKGRVGHVFMKAALRETNGVFGGELSGHFYYRDNFFTDSGAITFAVVLSILGRSDKTMSAWIDPLRKYPQSGERNFEAEDKQGAMRELEDRYAGRGEVDHLDGVTIDCWDTAGWWLNVRASNTEPLLRLNAEAKDEATLRKLLEEVTPLLGKPASGH